MGAFVAPFFMAGIIPGYAADQALDPLADVDLYRGWYDLTVMWPQSTSMTGSAGVVGIVNQGNGYTDGQAVLVPLIGGKGSGAQATLDFSGGYLTNVTMTTEGTNYYEGDLLYFDNTAAGQPAGAGGARIQVIGLGVQRDGGVQVKATTKPAAQLTIEERLAGMNRKEIEAFMVQEGLTVLSADGSFKAGLDPASFKGVATLREATAQAWHIVNEAKK